MKKMIVWIEDNTDIIDPLMYPLRKEGIDIFQIQTVKQAIENVEKIRNADLFILDVILPSGNNNIEFDRYLGLSLLKELREIHNVETPGIALTVVTRKEVRKALKKWGVIEVLRKPIRPSELKEVVSRILHLGP